TLGDSEAEPGATLLLGVRAVYLMELMENTCLLRLRNTWTCIGNSHPKLTIRRPGGNTDLAPICEFDGVPDKIKKNLRNAALIALPSGHGFRKVDLEGQFFGCSQRLCG